MQDTGAITRAEVPSGVGVTGVPMREQKLIVFGAGTAGVGIADQLRGAMVRGGATQEQATRQVWLVDKQDLLTDDMTDLRDFQKPYARKSAKVSGWDNGTNGAMSLLDTVRNVGPVVLPLSNPTRGRTAWPQRHPLRAPQPGVARLPGCLSQELQ